MSSVGRNTLTALLPPVFPATYSMENGFCSQERSEQRETRSHTLLHILIRVRPPRGHLEDMRHGSGSHGCSQPRSKARGVILFIQVRSWRGFGLLDGRAYAYKSPLESVVIYKLGLVFVATLAVVSHFCELIVMGNARAATNIARCRRHFFSLVGRR